MVGGKDSVGQVILSGDLYYSMSEFYYKPLTVKII